MSRARRKRTFQKGMPKFLRMLARRNRKSNKMRSVINRPDPVRQLLARVQVKE